MAVNENDKVSAVVELSDDQLEALEELAKEETRKTEELLESLGNSIAAKFDERAARRTSKENQWLRAARLYFGKLSIQDWYRNGETPFSGMPGSDRPDINIVRAKCNTAIAQTVSMQFGASNKNWDLFPSRNDPSPENAVACVLMEDEIEEQMEKTNYTSQCIEAMRDRVILGTGILKGPLSTGKMVRAYTKIEGTETWVPDVTVDYAPKLCRINPWFFYPDETTEKVDCLSDTIEVHPMSPLELKKLMQHPGFKPDAIMEVLESPPKEYRNNTWADFAKLSENNPHLYKGKYLVLEYHGPITRTQLDQLSICPTYDSLNDEYYGEVWVCDGKVIRVELESIEASFRPPYYLCEWEKDPASVFGFGVPLMMEDAQRVVNQSWHMILDNSALSSGPQVAIQKGLVEPANGKWELKPGAMWYLNDPQATIQQAIQFFNVPNITGEIVPILNMAMDFSDQESMIPLIAAGLTSPQPTDTATGGMMMQQASTTLLDFMSEAWDSNMTAPVIEAWYAWNMQHSNKSDIKGAFSVDVRTSTEYKNKQIHIRDLEKLSVESAQNPELAKWINQGELSRVRLSMMELPSKTIIKSAEQVAKEDAERAANAEPPIEMLQLQLEARKLALEEAQLQFETQQQQQREIWEHEEKMTANQARLVESQARVAVSQNEKETEMLKLAQRDRETAAKLLVQEKIARENLQTRAFEKGLEETRKQQELQIYDKEIELKRQTGSGI